MHLRPPNLCQARLEAVLLAAERVDVTYSAGDNHQFAIFTNINDTIDRLGQTPCIGTTCDLIKTICRRLRDARNKVVPVDWVPGYASEIGNDIVCECASEPVELRSSPALPVPFT